MQHKTWLLLPTYLALIFLLPLIAIALSGRDWGPYLDFPPRPAIIDPEEPFSWIAFGIIALLILASIAPFVWKIAKSASPESEEQEVRHPFPLFGWLGLAVTLTAWLLAWTRLEWFAPFQRLTFTPLWIGYILVVNAMAARRTGLSPLAAIGWRGTFALFVFSALFWWSFEYLNRFAGNWHYPVVQRLSAGQYFLEDTLPFSTVLPAVYSTASWLKTYPRMTRGLDCFAPLRLPPAKTCGLILAMMGSLSLVATVIWPQILFPFLWLAPVLLLSGLQLLYRGDSALYRAFASGNFVTLWTFALASLVCGFFWELWNFDSLAHWEYRIPYVGRFHVFEMPLLGYAGYLPFGILCALFIDSLGVRHCDKNILSIQGATGYDAPS